MMSAVIILTVLCVCLILACSFLLEIVRQLDKTNEELLEENQKLREKIKKQLGGYYDGWLR